MNNIEITAIQQTDSMVAVNQTDSMVAVADFIYTPFVPPEEYVAGALWFNFPQASGHLRTIGL